MLGMESAEGPFSFYAFRLRGTIFETLLLRTTPSETHLYLQPSYKFRGVSSCCNKIFEGDCVPLMRRALTTWGEMAEHDN